MKKTLQALEDIHALIIMFRNVFEEVRSMLNTDVSNSFFRLSNELQRMVSDGYISKDMDQQYRDVLVEIHQNRTDYSENTSDRINKLIQICNQQTEEIEQADKKISESLDLESDTDIIIKQEKSENSKDELEYINDQMRAYEQRYDYMGPMAAVDDFARIGNAIKSAVKNNTLTKESAEEMMEPLRDIQNNFFDDNVQKQKIAEFYKILNTKLSQNNNQGHDKTTLERVVDAIDSLRPKDKVNKEEQFREIRAKDIEQKPKVFAESRVEDQTKEEKQQEKQQENQKQTKKHTLDSVNQAVKKYINAVNKRSLGESLDAFVELGDEIKAAVEENVLSKEDAEKMLAPLRNVQKEGPLLYKAHEKAMNVLNQIINNQQGKNIEHSNQEVLGPQDKFAAFRAQLKPRDSEEQKTTNQESGRSQMSPELRNALFFGKNGRPQQHEESSNQEVLGPQDKFAAFRAQLKPRDSEEQKTVDSPLDKREDLWTKTTKDVTQKQDDVDKSLEEQRWTSVENPGKGNEQQSKEEVLRKIDSFILAYDNLSSNDPGEANYELDKFSKYISSAMKEGLISQQEAKQYKDIIDSAYMRKDGASETVEKLWNLREKGLAGKSQKQQTEQKTVDSPLDKREDLRTKTTKDVTQKQDDVDKSLEEQRRTSVENPGKGSEQQEKAVREQADRNKEARQNILQEQQSKEEASRKMESFKAGTQKAKDLMEERRKKIMNKMMLNALNGRNGRFGDD